MKRLYRRGYEFELRVRRHFESLGFVVWRPGGSKSLADLLALKPGEVILVQCRVGGRLGKAEREKLATLARDLGCKAMLAYRDNRKLRLEEVTWEEGRTGEG